MKVLSLIVGVVGLLIVAAAVIGRFYGASTVTLLGHTHTASAIMLAGNTVLLAGVWLGLLGSPRAS